MPTQLIKELLSHRLVIGALVIVGLIGAGSLTYYLIEANPPALAFVPATIGTVSHDVPASGVVEPAQNPQLAFQMGGQVASVDAVVGQRVAQGTLLATLDTGVLSASLAGSEAHLGELQAGPRASDLASKQTAVTNAELSLQNLYAALPGTLQDAAGKAEEAVYAKTDALFNFPSTNPALTIDTSPGPSQSSLITLRTQIEDTRRTYNTTLPAFLADASALSSAQSPAELDAELSRTLATMREVRTYLDEVIALLNQTNPTDSFPQTSITAALASATSGRDNVNAVIQSLTSTQAALASGAVSVQSAKDTLNQVLAGSDPHEVAAAQAQVASVAAQVRAGEIRAPFAGTVASVSIKPGDFTQASVPEIVLIPDAQFEVPVYVTEVDVASITIGDIADVTLDAYGKDRTFAAAVASVDHAPTTPPGGGAPAYKVVLVFTKSDPSIVLGMHANATIHTGSATGVLTVPTTALIREGDKVYVLKGTSANSTKVEVGLGVVGDTTAQITSGLVAGDTVARVGTH